MPAGPGAAFEVVEAEGGVEFAVVVSMRQRLLARRTSSARVCRRVGRTASSRWVRSGRGAIARVASIRAGLRRRRGGVRVGWPGRRDAPVGRRSARIVHRRAGPGFGRVWVAGRASAPASWRQHRGRWRGVSGCGPAGGSAVRGVGRPRCKAPAPAGRRRVARWSTTWSRQCRGYRVRSGPGGTRRPGRSRRRRSAAADASPTLPARRACPGPSAASAGTARCRGPWMPPAGGGSARSTRRAAAAPGCVVSLPRPGRG